MHESNTAFIKNEDFKTIIHHTPLVSVDLIVKHNNKILRKSSTYQTGVKMSEKKVALITGITGQDGGYKTMSYYE